MLVLTLGDGVAIFTLDRETGLVGADASGVQIPETPKSSRST
jgi:fructose-1,6-bisphosphatase